jgi:hypothetical protein
VIFYGGIAQFTAGLMEWKKGNTYGLTAYGSYGLFWFSFAALLLLPGLGLAQGTGGRVQWLRTLPCGAYSRRFCSLDRLKCPGPCNSFWEHSHSSFSCWRQDN